MNTDNSMNNMCYSTSGNSICVEAKGGICTPMVHIRTALVDDVKELLSIYAPYVMNTAITFEYDVPSLEEFQGRIEATLRKYPYIVALYNERIVGYAYAGMFHERKAYDRCVETSIYVDKDMRHMGIGRLLHDELERELKDRGILNMYACIAYPKEDDEYLDKNSAMFHAHLGYRLVGEFYDCGYKFGRWYNMVWMEKLIGEHI